jgi:hypothetical protein
MATSKITKPDLPELLGPVLASLPVAAVSKEPADGVLPCFSEIIRQRLQYLSSPGTEPWIRLLCYDASKADKLTQIAQSGCLEPHPVSGEIEVDWDYDAEIRYRRVDVDTLQALVTLKDIGLVFLLVYCKDDPIGGDGWKVGEVSAADSPSPFTSFGGASDIAGAEGQFEESTAKALAVPTGSEISASIITEEDDDDDNYWARYDATPANRTPAVQTPANKRSPAPVSAHALDSSADDEYYAQYDSVQPAMDNHDPDEVANVEALAPELSSQPGNTVANGFGEEEIELNETKGAWTLTEPPRSSSTSSRRIGDEASIAQPRPASSASSRSSVAKLEVAAENFGVQQHISRSIKSLYMLSRASGIDREEFERIVRTQLDTLGLMED